MKIFVTGDKGFVGSHLMKSLADNGHILFGYDMKNGLDITNRRQLTAIMKGFSPDIVIHLAALAGVRDGEQEPSDYLETNVVGTQNVINACKASNVKHLISFSSSSVLGNQNPPNTEEDTMQPIGIYGISKMTGEWLVRHSGLSSSIIRPFTIYGENGRPNQVIYKWINCIKDGKPIPFFGDGNTKRGYTYIGDLIGGINSIVDKVKNELINGVSLDGNTCEVYNLGGTEVISLNDLLSIFEGVIEGFTVERKELPFGDVAENWADITKAQNILGYKAETKFKDKVTEIIRNELWI